MGEKSTNLMICHGLAIFLIVSVVFAVNVRNRFLQYDDYTYIVMNPHISEGLTPRSVWWAFRSCGYGDNWHPLTWISHAFDNTLADGFALDWREESNRSGVVVNMDKLPFSRLVHSENIVFHAANAVLLWILMLCFVPTKCREDPAVLLVPTVFSLFWALHPLRVEVVAWASERKELLSVFFMLLSLISYFCVEKGRKIFGNPYDRHLPLVFFILAALAKPVAVSLPVLIFAYDVFADGRRVGESLRRIVPFAVFSAITCYYTMISQTTALELGSQHNRLTQLLCVVETPIIYLFQTAWPVGLAIDYPFPTVRSWPVFLLGLGLLTGIAAALVRAVRKRDAVSRFLVLAVAWIYVGLLPMLGIVRIGFEPHNDRYTYWIGCGMSFFACLAFVRLRPQGIVNRKGLLAFAALALVCLSALTVRQSLVWKDTLTLFTDAAEKSHGERFIKAVSDISARTTGSTAQED